MLAGFPAVARRRNVTILTSCVDAGGTPTTMLRPKLLLAKIDASGKYNTYDPTLNDGRQIPVAVLEYQTNMIAGGAGDKVASIIEGGLWTDTELIGIDQLALELLTRRGFEFRAAATINHRPSYFGIMGDRGTYTVAGDTVVTAAQNGYHFAATAACDFTLPAVAPGLAYRFSQQADANMGVTGAAVNLLMVDGNMAATLLRFSTASHKKGACVVVRSAYDYVAAAWKWQVLSLCPNAQTIT